jgi:hypothetical protein
MGVVIAFAELACSLCDPSGFVIKGTTILGKRPAPVMAAFSSQGPNAVNPEILKVTARVSVT